MALMYDMETVNKAIQAAKSLTAEDIKPRELWILNQFATMEPVEAEPIVHARWIPVHAGYRCSACATFKKKNKKKRCICGAIMDRGQEKCCRCPSCKNGLT